MLEPVAGSSRSATELDNQTVAQDWTSWTCDIFNVVPGLPTYQYI